MKKAEELYQCARAHYCQRCEYYPERCVYAQGRIKGECFSLDDYLSGYEKAQQDMLKSMIDWLKANGNKYVGLVTDDDKSSLEIYEELYVELKKEFGYD